MPPIKGGKERRSAVETDSLSVDQRCHQVCCRCRPQITLPSHAPMRGVTHSSPIALSIIRFRDRLTRSLFHSTPIPPERERERERADDESLGARVHPSVSRSCNGGQRRQMPISHPLTTNMPPDLWIIDTGETQVLLMEFWCSF